jgi:hypothetical protein
MTNPSHSQQKRIAAQKGETMRYGEDANRLALALDKAEPGSELEREIIRSFLTRFASERMAEARIEEAKWWVTETAIECNGCAVTEGRSDKRVADLESASKGVRR